MNWYFYWYFTIYSVYKRHSWDKHFDIFATGMFSVFVSCLLIGSIGFLLCFIDLQGLLLNNGINFIIPGIIILIINYLIFLPKVRQMYLYDLYKEKQSTLRDVFTIFISVFSIVIIILYGIKAHAYLNQ